MDPTTVALIVAVVGVSTALIALHYTRRSTKIAEREQAARIEKDKATEPNGEIPEPPRRPQTYSQDIAPDRNVVGRDDELAQLRHDGRKLVDDSFISYNSADEKKAEWIAWTLRKADYTVRFAKWECAAGTDIAQWMISALDDCARIICVASPNYLKPKAKYSALERAAMLWTDIDGSERKLVFVKITECKLPVIFAARSYISFAGLGRDEARQRLLDGLRGPTIPKTEPDFGEPWIHRDRAPVPKIDLPEPPRWPHICSPGIAPGRNVVGRDDELAQLRFELETEHATTIVSGIVIKGQGGMGKTILAREYAHKFRSKYYGIWWLPAQTRETLTTSLCELAAALGVTADPQAGPDGLAHAALVRVQQDKHPWLLIFDDAIGPRDLRGWLPEAGHIHILVTTREGGWPEERFKLLRTGELDFSAEDSPAAALLMQEAGRTTDRAGARTLAETLGGLPLALVIAGAYLRNAPDVSFTAYATNVERAIARTLPEGGDKSHSIFSAVSLSLERLSPAAAQIANILAFWAPEGLKPGHFTQVAEEETDEHNEPIPAELWPVLREEGEVAQAFAELARRSHLERRGEGIATHFAMHRLTGAVIRARLGVEGRARWREAAVSVLAAAYPYDSDLREHWPACAALTPHVQALAGHGADSAAAVYLYNQAAGYLGVMRQDLPALMLARASLRAKKRRLDPLHRDIGVGYLTLGLRWKALGRPVIAEKLLAQAVAIAEKNSEMGDEDRAAIFSNHGGALEDRGRQAQAAGKAAAAADWFRRAARRIQRALLLDRRRGDRRAVARDLNNLSTLRAAQGRRAAGIRLARMTLHIRREVLAPGDTRLADSLHNLAAGLLETSDCREAEPLLDEALAIREGAFAAYPRHPDLVDTATGLATAALMRGDRGKAEAIAARYPDDLDLGKLERDALAYHLRIKTDSGKTGREALKEALDLMGLTGDDVRRILSDLDQPPDPT